MLNNADRVNERGVINMRFVDSLNGTEIEYEPECQVILIQPILDKKLAARIKRDFSSPLSINEFIRSCNSVPYLICDDLPYRNVLQILSDNKEYSEYIKVELV